MIYVYECIHTCITRVPSINVCDDFTVSDVHVSVINYGFDAFIIVDISLFHIIITSASNDFIKHNWLSSFSFHVDWLLLLLFYYFIFKTFNDADNDRYSFGW